MLGCWKIWFSLLGIHQAVNTCILPHSDNLCFTQTCSYIQREPVKSNSKRVSTSHIPCVSQPAALFVDQRTDIMSFYLLHHPTSSLQHLSQTLSLLLFVQNTHLTQITTDYFSQNLLTTPSYFCLSPPLRFTWSVHTSLLPPPFLPPLRCGSSCCACFHFPSSLVRGNQVFQRHQCLRLYCMYTSVCF